MHVMHSILTRHTWLMFIGVLALACTRDDVLGGVLEIGVALACALRVIGFAQEATEPYGEDR